MSLLSHGPLCGRATCAQATDALVIWQDTRSSHVTGRLYDESFHIKDCVYSFWALQWLVCTLLTLLYVRLVARPQISVSVTSGESQSSDTVAVAQPLSVSSERFRKTQWPGSRRQRRACYWVVRGKAAWLKLNVFWRLITSKLKHSVWLLYEWMKTDAAGFSKRLLTKY
jgi:hypothetical protein